VTCTGVNHGEYGERVSRNLEWETLMQRVPPDFQKYRLEFTKTRHFKQKVVFFWGGRRLCPLRRPLPQWTALLASNQAFWIDLCVSIRILAGITSVLTTKNAYFSEQLKRNSITLSWSQRGPRLVADLQRAGIWPITSSELARASTS